MLPRPQPPGALLEAMAGEGCLTPDEADRLRQFVDVRNRVAHGGLGVEVASKDIEAVVAVLKTLLAHLRSQRTSS
jgi:uncharacterized protein YutE (UPF0331/DUF86 family)